ncbi:hypothetical protein CONLIGDRAFT_646420 [Coniochaeta ligniaria NRRL 30616]|uniref:CPAF-like PDZ domain-containing protein n=1 Tax=Coniochaeta ligniaria NRRL 30616 TaxID=1408157 RepID=A0A1J7IG22_9PEZI|nr:hypothetical protein CONLIGDRAFT_646420 [Coniochaeta ligniaria NRRL 30616]
MAFLRFLLIQAVFGPVWAQSASVEIIPSVTAAAASLSTACAVAGSASASAEAAAEPGAAVSIPPSLALACLQSVPVDVDNDVALIDYIASPLTGVSLMPFIKVQSTLGYLKDPPKGYLIPGVDLLSGLTEIRQKLRNIGYSNQYEFTWDIARLISAAADGHLAYTPALNSVFLLTRTLNLVSISDDGLQLPKIYDHDDLIRSTEQGYTAADLTMIDGVPILDYLIDLSALLTQQDPDAAFNALFTNIPFRAAGSGEGFVLGSISALPDFHNVSFSNGSSTVYKNVATVAQSLADIDSGDKLHSKVELPSPASTSPPSARVKREIISAPSTTLSALPGYPSPVEIHIGREISGYFLNDTAHMDTCVLVLAFFEPKYSDGQEDLSGNLTSQFLEFRRVTRSFFKDCKDANRTKLLIDLSANGGGNLFDSYELYRNLFPTGPAHTGNRIRATAAWDIIGQHIWGQPLGQEKIGNVLDSSGKPFPDWQSLFGPKIFPQDNETNIMTYDLTNDTTVAGVTNSFIITGFDPSDPAPPQPFATSDIVIVTDGSCASACTVFTGLMVREQGVRTIALGGRPNRQAMQYAGGVKGVEVMSFSDLQDMVSQITPFIGNATLPSLNLTLPSTVPPPLNPTDLKDARFNYRNGYAANGTDGPPLQFVYEAAHCRRFYKAEYLTDITAQWRDLADVAWNSAPCAPGSSVNSDGTIGDTVLGFDEAVVSKQSAYNGPGSLTKSGGVTEVAAGAMRYVVFTGLIGLVLLL